MTSTTSTETSGQIQTSSWWVLFRGAQEGTETRGMVIRRVQFYRSYSVSFLLIRGVGLGRSSQLRERIDFTV